MSQSTAEVTNEVVERPTCFLLKTSFSPCTILQILDYDLDKIAQQIPTTVQRAPNFFLGSPVVIDLEPIKTLGKVDFNRIKQILITNNLVPIGVRGGTEEQHQDAVTAGIPLISVGANGTKAPKADPVVAATTKKAVPDKQVSLQPTKIITTPIRSGMSVYAKDGDLIVIAPVSAGAELMADGNIHVYGPLRGRAMAGVQGNVNARIFCSTLEAELVAIAGYYLVKEDIHNLPVQAATVQVFLENEQVKIEKV